MEVDLKKNLPRPRTKYLVFTSAGDKANLRWWLKGERNFDLWINYYGSKENRYIDLGDFYTMKKGDKFANYHFVYQKWEDILNRYQAIMVMDDDVIIDGAAINRLFKIREEYDLWVLQPAFSPKGKISHRITRVNPLTYLRYTNFVEMTCPLFLKDKLNNFMKVYDPGLIGYGVDYWYIDSMGPDIGGKVAIVDEISCINPHDRVKGGQREIDRLCPLSERINAWEKIKNQYHIPEREHREFGSIKRSLNFSCFFDAITIITHLITLDGIKRKIKKLIRLVR